MAVGDLTAELPVLIDVNNTTLIKSTIDALNLAAATDVLHVIPIPDQHKVMIFVVERASS